MMMRAIDGLGWTALAFCALLLVTFGLWSCLSQPADVDCSGCPPTADACLCVTPEPTPDHGWFPCTLSNGVQAMCSIGGGSVSEAYAPAVPDYQAPASGFGYQYGYNLRSADFGFGFGWGGINYLSMGDE